MPDATAVTSSIVPEPPEPLLMVPVTDAVEAAPIATKLVVPNDTMVYVLPIVKLPAVTVIAELERY